MQLPQLTSEQIQERCTGQSYMRGLNYFHDGAIDNATLHGYTLSGTCEGTDIDPYRVTVELMPTGIAAAYCSCPYDWEGDCKHIAALLLTYVETPDAIDSLDALFAALEAKPKSSLVQVISELLKRAPELVPIVQAYSDLPVTSPCPGPLPLVAVYRDQIDRIFGRGFLEQHQLHHVLSQLEDLRRHAASLAQLDETELALSMLHALIDQSIARYPDTLQKSELPRFVNKCTQAFTQIAMGAQEPAAIQEHCRTLLRLSFEAEPAFTSLLTSFLEQLCLMEEPEGLQAAIEQALDESPDRLAHVRLLLALYFQSGKIEDYLRLARSEGEGYRLIHALFALKRDDAGWKALKTFPLSVDEYWRLLQNGTHADNFDSAQNAAGQDAPPTVGLVGGNSDSRLKCVSPKNPTCRRVRQFTETLLNLLKSHHTDLALQLYQKLIDATILSRKREDYEKVGEYLTQLRTCYQQLNQENRWSIYLAEFQKRHARKRLLLKIIAESPLTS